MTPLNYVAGIAADATVRTSPGFYFGYIVTVATATEKIDIKDGSTVIDTIPAGTAAGTQRVLPHPIRVDGALTVDFAATATGTLTVLHTG